VGKSRRPGRGADDSFHYVRPSWARGDERGREFTSDNERIMKE
jgi:hypothetical protein